MYLLIDLLKTKMIIKGSNPDPKCCCIFKTFYIFLLFGWKPCIFVSELSAHFESVLDNGYFVVIIGDGKSQLEAISEQMHFKTLAIVKKTEHIKILSFFLSYIAPLHF